MKKRKKVLRRKKKANSRLFTITRNNEEFKEDHNLNVVEVENTRTYQIIEKKDRFSVFELQRKKKPIPVKTIKKSGVIHNLDNAVLKVKADISSIRYRNINKLFGTKRNKKGELVRDKDKIIINDQSNFYMGKKTIRYGEKYSNLHAQIPSQAVGRVLVTNTEVKRRRKNYHDIFICYSYAFYSYQDEDLPQIKEQMFKMARAKYAVKHGMGKKGNSNNKALVCELLDLHFIRRYSIGKRAGYERANYSNYQKKTWHLKHTGK
jgi:hypothetical protein